jgi:hypothetical protein
VELVISDADAGLTEAIAAVLPGASWPRRRTQFIRNLLCRVPTSAQRVVEQLQERFPQAAELLADAAGDLLAFHGVPRGALASDLVQQSPTAARQGTAPENRRGRHLSQPDGGAVAGRGGPGRATR